MRLDVTAAAAFDWHGQKLYGTVRWIEDDFVGFTTYVPLAPGDQLKMRLELPGYYETVDSRLLLRNVEAGAGGVLTCTGEILDMTELHSETLATWIDQRSHASSMSRNRRARPPRIGDSKSSATPSRMREGSATETNESASGRAALRDALRKGLGQTGPSQVDPTRSGESALRNHLLAEPASEVSADGTTVTVSWKTWAGLSDVWRRELSRGLLTLNIHSRSPPEGFELTVRARLPDGQILALAGKVQSSTRGRVELGVQIPRGAWYKLRKAQSLVT